MHASYFKMTAEKHPYSKTSIRFASACGVKMHKHQIVTQLASKEKGVSPQCPQQVPRKEVFTCPFTTTPNQDDNRSTQMFNYMTSPLSDPWTSLHNLTSGRTGQTTNQPCPTRQGTSCLRDCADGSSASEKASPHMGENVDLANHHADTKVANQQLCHQSLWQTSCQDASVLVSLRYGQWRDHIVCSTGQPHFYSTECKMLKTRKQQKCKLLFALESTIIHFCFNNRKLQINRRLSIQDCNKVKRFVFKQNIFKRN